MKKTEIPAISEEEREKITKSLIAESWMVTYKVLEDLIGTEAALEEIRPYLHNAGYAFASNMRNLYKIEGNDIHTIGVVSALGNLFFEIDAREIEHTDDRIVVVCTSCTWQNCPIGICRMGHIWAQYYVEAVNPDYEERVTQMISKGDPICSWVIEKKKK
jgi:predicted hydrocarbon binding protein